MARTSGRVIWLIEDPLYYGNDPHWPTAMHRQKLMLHRASMKAYAADLEAAGETVFVIGAIEAGARGCTVQGSEETWSARTTWEATHLA